MALEPALKSQVEDLENPRDGEPGGLLSTGLYRVRHYRSDLAAAAAAAAEEFPGGPVLGL